MSISTFSSREFNQKASEVKRATENGPVFITHRGEVAHVLLTFEEFQKLSGTSDSIIDCLAMPEAAEIEFDPPKLGNGLFRPEEFD